jgi:hypothetical protein
MSGNPLSPSDSGNKEVPSKSRATMKGDLKIKWVAAFFEKVFTIEPTAVKKTDSDPGLHERLM